MLKNIDDFKTTDQKIGQLDIFQLGQNRAEN
jgi:hypothetical protein